MPLDVEKYLTTNKIVENFSKFLFSKNFVIVFLIVFLYCSDSYYSNKIENLENEKYELEEKISSLNLKIKNISRINFINKNFNEKFKKDFAEFVVNLDKENFNLPLERAIIIKKYGIDPLLYIEE